MLVQFQVTSFEDDSEQGMDELVGPSMGFSSDHASRYEEGLTLDQRDAQWRLNSLSSA